jgi:hypothetical protein
VHDIAHPFAIEQPEALRGLLRSLAQRLTAAADTNAVHIGESTPDDEVVDPDPM